MSGRKRSDIWHHFIAVNQNVARCKYCHNTLSTKSGSVGNLPRHMKKKHKSIPLDKSATNLKSEVYKALVEAEKSLNSTMADFNKVSPSEETCNSRLEFVSTGNEMTEIVDLMENKSALGVLSDGKIKNAGSKKRSRMWAYFKQLPNGKAKCCYCTQILSFVGGSTGNLNRHMKMKHFTDVLTSGNEEENDTVAIEYRRSSTPSFEDADVKPNINKMTLNRNSRNHLNMKLRSDCWKHFIKMSRKKAKCLTCGKVLNIAHGATGNLTRHMKMKHPEVEIGKGRSSFDRVNESLLQEMDITEADTSYNHNSTVVKADLAEYIKLNASPKKISSDLKISNLTFNEYSQQLVKMIVKEFYPFSIVDGVEFKKFIQMLCPTYNLPSRKIISTSLIPHLYEVTLEKVRHKVSEASSVCLAMEGWTSISNDYYVSITAHFIDINTELCSYMLGCISFNDSDTSKYIASLMKQKVEEWGLEDKVEAVVTENIPNLTNAIYHAGWTHIHCFAHSINLIVHAGLSEIKFVIEKVKFIVDIFLKRNDSYAQLESIQEQLDLPKVKLKKAIGTRWKSVYDMLSRFVTNKEAIISLSDVLESKSRLSDHEWEVIKKSLEILEIFNVMTNEIKSEKVVSVSKLIFYARAMDKFIQKYINNNVLLPEIRKMLEALRDQLVSHFKDVENNNISLEATLLDPRFKRKAFIDDKHFSAAYSLLSQQVSNVILEMPLQEVNPDEKHSSLVELWEDFDYEVNNDTSVINSTRMAILELDKYLQEPLFDRRENPLTWWREWKRLYPRCYEVMKRRLCITATSVPCEMIFTNEGQNMMDKRSRIYSSKISEILFLNYNLE